MDGIPALTNPELVEPGAPGTEPFRDDDRVVGFFLGGQPVAVPLNIFWWHEIVNLDFEGSHVSVTHCPLTGSSIGFDRSEFPDVEFGVSGLLYLNNLVMYDRSGGSDTLWPQMALGARCGELAGSPLPLAPVIEMTYGAWRALHPETLVVSSETGHDRNYEPWAYPYGAYDDPSNRELLFPMPGGTDLRRPPKERVLGVPAGSGGLAYPYEALAELGNLAVVHGAIAGVPHVVFWSAEARGAAAFRTVLDGTPMTFVVSEGGIVDLTSGSRWTVDGRATAGPLKGRRLDPVPRAFVAFWFAWPRFYPDIALWSP